MKKAPFCSVGVVHKRAPRGPSKGDNPKQKALKIALLPICPNNSAYSVQPILR
jgi:hypothetical protein